MALATRFSPESGRSSGRMVAWYFTKSVMPTSFFNEEKRGQYQKVLLDSVSVYSRDSDGETSIAEKASDYLESGVKQLLAERKIGASEPGPAY